MTNGFGMMQNQLRGAKSKRPAPELSKAPLQSAPFMAYFPRRAQAGRAASVKRCAYHAESRKKFEFGAKQSFLPAWCGLSIFRPGCGALKVYCWYQEYYIGWFAP